MPPALTALPGRLVLVILELARGELSIFALLIAFGPAGAGDLPPFDAVLKLRELAFEFEKTFVTRGAERAGSDRRANRAAGVGAMFAVVELALGGEFLDVREAITKGG